MSCMHWTYDTVRWLSSNEIHSDTFGHLDAMIPEIITEMHFAEFYFMEKKEEKNTLS